MKEIIEELRERALKFVDSSAEHGFFGYGNEDVVKFIRDALEAKQAQMPEDVAECLLYTPEEAFADNGASFPVRETLRAHIAAQAAEIETKQKCLNIAWKKHDALSRTEQELRKGLSIAERMCREQAAEIERLRGLLKSGNHTYLGGEYVLCIDPKKAKAALAGGKDTQCVG